MMRRKESVVAATLHKGNIHASASGPATTGPLATMSGSLASQLHSAANAAAGQSAAPSGDKSSAAVGGNATIVSTPGKQTPGKRARFSALTVSSATFGAFMKHNRPGTAPQGAGSIENASSFGSTMPGLSSTCPLGMPPLPPTAFRNRSGSNPNNVHVPATTHVHVANDDGTFSAGDGDRSDGSAPSASEASTPNDNHHTSSSTSISSSTSTSTSTSMSAGGFTGSTSSASNAPDPADNQSIRVVVRLRPLNDRERDALSSGNGKGGDEGEHLQIDGSNTTILTAQRQFTFDAVMDENTTQKEVFELTGKRIVESCIAGYHGAILAYGQTGTLLLLYHRAALQLMQRCIDALGEYHSSRACTIVNMLHLSTYIVFHFYHYTTPPISTRFWQDVHDERTRSRGHRFFLRRSFFMGAW